MLLVLLEDSVLFMIT